MSHRSEVSASPYGLDIHKSITHPLILGLVEHMPRPIHPRADATLSVISFLLLLLRRLRVMLDVPLVTLIGAEIGVGGGLSVCILF